ncbi:RteC domain-containing protein [Neotamlana laminarinivorans]|uniref:RteC domain-containing protein n=1 Tax=Neotamlana laminarinivorans TaxID=2883124 RepID=A0A9X1I316_9FLAO|nr:RteC domain-containing protein [Tamlana laminarinivorans]MCB4800135.1 RteC domain-containing protein [Tamlana laminarinivorans]
MKLNSLNQVATELKRQLKLINKQENDRVNRLKLCYDTSCEALTKLKQKFKLNEPQTDEEEVHFFKNIKPVVLSKVIKYGMLCDFEIKHVVLPSEIKLKEYKNCIKMLKVYFEENQEFYKYYRMKDTSYDQKYFTRLKRNETLHAQAMFYAIDSDFSTSHDVILATFMAYENIFNYVENQIAVLQNQPKSHKNLNRSVLKWTANKSDLVELIYALQTAGAINNGGITLKDLVESLEDVFNIQLGDYSRIFYDIQLRSNPTKFLGQLQDALEIKIERSL